jgi:hypothetical protein
MPTIEVEVEVEVEMLTIEVEVEMPCMGIPDEDCSVSLTMDIEGGHEIALDAPIEFSKPCTGIPDEQCSVDLAPDVEGGIEIALDISIAFSNPADSRPTSDPALDIEAGLEIDTDVAQSTFQFDFSSPDLPNPSLQIQNPATTSLQISTLTTDPLLIHPPESDIPNPTDLNTNHLLPSSHTDPTQSLNLLNDQSFHINTSINHPQDYEEYDEGEIIILEQVDPKGTFTVFQGAPNALAL